jgi:uncharacterized protein with PIN domain
MSHGGVIAVVTLLITNVGTLIGSWVAIANLRSGITKEHANRRIVLEQYADDIGRYIRRLRVYLLDRLKAGMRCPHCGERITDVIDANQLDMSQFTPPAPPKYNGS